MKNKRKLVPEINSYNVELRKNGCSRCGQRYPVELQNGAFKIIGDESRIFCSPYCANKTIEADKNKVSDNEVSDE